MTANNTPFKDFILIICFLRNDTRFKEVKFKVESAVSDLHAADARYHQEYETIFLHLNYLDGFVKTSENNVGNALHCFIEFMKANAKKMWNSVEVENIYSKNEGYKLNKAKLDKRTAKKVFLFGVILVRIFPHSD